MKHAHLGNPPCAPSVSAARLGASGMCHAYPSENRVDPRWEGMRNVAFTRHNPDSVPAPVGGYSQAVELPPGARILFISGQIPERPGEDLAADFRSQCEAAWQNIEAVLAAAGMDVGDLVKVTTFLTSEEQVVENRQVRQRHLGDASPAMSVVIVRTLDPRWLLEIEAIAARVEG